MIAPTPVSNVSRVAANQTSSGSASRDSGTRTSITSNSSASGETSEVLVAMEATKRQAVSGNGGSGQGQGEGSGSDSGTGSGSSAAPSEQNSAAVDTAIRTDSAGLEAAQSAINNDSAGLEAAKAAVENNLTQLASDPDKFHEVLNKSFGGNYNKAEAEQIRQQVLEGDFSWMPKIEVVSQSVLQDRSNTQGSGTALGAYSKDTDTIYISRELLASDPDKAAQILLEETGHALDARLNTSDAAGDEGDIFARLTTGESISDS